MKKIKIIAHGANSLDDIKAAFAAGANLVEVDVSKQVFGNRFVAQHQGVLGKLGIGTNLELVLKEIPQDKIIFDIKHPQFTPSFFGEFKKLLEKFRFFNINVTSDNWPVLAKFSEIGSFKPFFLVENPKNAQKLLKLKALNNKIHRLIISGKFLNYVKLKSFKQQQFEVFAGPIDNDKLLNKAVRLGVEGIITDEVAKLTRLLKPS